MSLPGLWDDHDREARHAALAGQRRGHRRPAPRLTSDAPECAEVVLRLQDSKRLGEDAIALYRKEHGLLSADDIRALRERFDLNQADLARLLRLGANTSRAGSRAGTCRRAAMDMLLRLIRAPARKHRLPSRSRGLSEPRVTLGGPVPSVFAWRLPTSPSLDPRMLARHELGAGVPVDAERSRSPISAWIRSPRPLRSRALRSPPRLRQPPVPPLPRTTPCGRASLALPRS